MKSSQKGFKLPSGLKIGERFLLSFDDPSLIKTPQTGRLQDMSTDGALCIDVPAELSPPRGTPVTISSLRKSPFDYRFSSEILGRGRINGRLPVLLVKAPETLEKQQRRTAFRISVALKARVQWNDPEAQDGMLDKPAVVTNLSGGGAQIFVRHRPDAKILRLSLSIPDAFTEEWAMRKLGRMGARQSRPSVFSDPFQQACAELRTTFDGIEAHIIQTHKRSEDARGSIHTLSVAFCAQHEGCYRLVRYLERQAAQKGVANLEQAVATAA